MSVTSRSPLRMAGANIHSGNVNTGEIPWTQGGGARFTCFSGGIRNLSSGGTAPPTGAPAVTADHAVIYSGAGRLNEVLPHQAISGVVLVFYDAATPGLSGPGTYTNSGYPIIGLIPANTIGSYALLGGGPFLSNFGFPFNSGLCVANASGCPGFTVTFTPEVNLPNPG